MNSNCLFCVVGRILVVLVPFAASQIALSAQEAADSGAQLSIRDPRTPPRGVPQDAARYWSALGLPRLRSSVLPEEAAPLRGDVFEVDRLEKSADPTRSLGQRTTERDGVKLIELDPGRKWERPLLSGWSNAFFVSLKVYASEGTVLNVENIRLLVTDGDMEGTATLRIVERREAGDDESLLGVHVPWDEYSGTTMAALPVLTIRYDALLNVWDLFVGARPIASNLPIPETTTNGGVAGIGVLAGKGGAWIAGLVQSKDNPLFEDANANGVDDDFERQKLAGVCLPTSATLDERKAIASQWRSASPPMLFPALLVEGPKPDRLDREVSATKGGRP